MPRVLCFGRTQWGITMRCSLTTRIKRHAGYRLIMCWKMRNHSFSIRILTNKNLKHIHPKTYNKATVSWWGYLNKGWHLVYITSQCFRHIAGHWLYSGLCNLIFTVTYDLISLAKMCFGILFKTKVCSKLCSTVWSKKWSEKVSICFFCFFFVWSPSIPHHVVQP